MMQVVTTECDCNKTSRKQIVVRQFVLLGHHHAQHWSMFAWLVSPCGLVVPRNAFGAAYCIIHTHAQAYDRTTCLFVCLRQTNRKWLLAITLSQRQSITCTSFIVYSVCLHWVDPFGFNERLVCGIQTKCRNQIISPEHLTPYFGCKAT